MRIDVWSDLVCPWCYIGKRRLESALAAFDHRDEVTVVHHAFRLHPDLPVGSTIAKDGMLQQKYRLSADQLNTMHERLEQVAAEEGLAYDLTGGVTGNTLDGHRLVRYAETVGRQDAMVERLFKAYFTERRSIFDHDSLTELAVEAGFDAETVARVLAGHEYAADVEGDQESAQKLGAHGVPFFVIAGRFGVSGAQPVEVFADALRQAWDAHATAVVP
jgi:predicted DsbA family dithiol-disulfide isomerase